eukprot:1316550-Pleurochrysis_carterae.AAC.1
MAASSTSAASAVCPRRCPPSPPSLPRRPPSPPGPSSWRPSGPPRRSGVYQCADVRGRCAAPSAPPYRRSL